MDDVLVGMSQERYFILLRNPSSYLLVEIPRLVGGLRGEMKKGANVTKPMEIHLITAACDLHS